MKRNLFLLFAAGSVLTQAHPLARGQSSLPPVPTELPALRYTNDFFPGTAYRPGVPTQESLLGFPSAQRAASPAEIERCIKAWTVAAPERTRLVEYARSHEGRPLHYVIVTAPKNLSRLDEIQAGAAKLGDPRSLSDAEAQQLIGSLPAVAWLAYTIHGDETEGSDAALALLYHLIAASDPKVEKLLEDVVVIIDPLMNPDGRERFIKMIAENRGTTPNVDDQSLLHGGYWPRGRGNHYLFDLNRDAIYGVHPETRGRLREVARWNPLLFVDAHGMGAQNTHLFSPPREPINPNLPETRRRWGGVFAREQTQAFDRHGLFYYNGEWNEEWYPGYTDGWASYRGAVGILYEQARIAEDGVRRPEGRILSYRESVQHHVIGSMANLATLQANAKPLRESFYNTRRFAVDPTGPYARRTFAVLPTANRSRFGAFAESLRLQGFELFRAENEFTAPAATDPLGRESRNKVVPKGTLLIPNRQPLAHLVAAMLEFDPRLSPAALEDERRELLLKGKSRLYDTTSWNLTMMYGLEALTLATELPASAKPFPTADTVKPGVVSPPASPVAYVIDGTDDFSMAAAARLMERGVQVRVAEKPFRLDEREFARGSVVVALLDNRSFAGDLRQTLARTVEELGLAAVGLGSGFGPGDLPDLGGEYFQRLEPPRIALLGRGGLTPGDHGSTWFVLDHRLGIRHSNVDVADTLDLARYNVLVVPDGRAASLSSNLVGGIKDWVKAGGTLIAVANSVGSFVSEKAEFSKVRPLPDVLGKLADYELAIHREWLGRTGQMPVSEAIWTHQATPGLAYPWQSVDGAHPEEKELKKRDVWQTLFMPQGAMLASRVDTNHWLTFGCAEMLPVLVGQQPVLMAADSVEAPIRYGVLAAKAKGTNAAAATETKAKTESEAERKESEKKDKKEPPRVGWCALPEGAELHLRMSGLLWPEAGHRLANAAWVTRERFGRGQIILFATPPTFRAATRGTTRVFLNALVCGPGFGADQPIRP
ncbi:MAG: peptidase [Verrucomicrobia bacterium]|nr:peptidase [Verrucomicrobiota bacterium]